VGAADFAVEVGTGPVVGVDVAATGDGLGERVACVVHPTPAVSSRAAVNRRETVPVPLRSDGMNLF
jgi:hypothetical protein